MYFLYLVILVFCLYYVNHKFTHLSNVLIIICWFLLFILIGTYGYFTDDYESYVDTVTLAYVNPYANLHIEPFWIKLADICNGNITLFRFISFILLTLSMLLICEATSVELKSFICYYTFLCLVSHVCWIRQPLSMFIFLSGFIYLIKKHYIIAFICLVCSYYFHKIGLIFLLMCILCIIPINKKSILIYVIGLPVFFIGFNILLNSASFSFMPFLLLYLESAGEFEDRNIIFTILSAGVTIIQFLLMLNTIRYFNKTNNKTIKYLSRYIMGVMVISVYLMILPFETSIMYKRLLAMGNLIMVIIFSITVKNNLFYKSFYSLSIPLILKIIFGETYSLGNNYTRIEKLTKPF